MKPSEVRIIRDKVHCFGMRSAIIKAIEEVDELRAELVEYLESWDADKSKPTLEAIARRMLRENADVTVTVRDTFSVIHEDIGREYDAKREYVYRWHLPKEIAKNKQEA